MSGISQQFMTPSQQFMVGPSHQFMSDPLVDLSPAQQFVTGLAQSDIARHISFSPTFPLASQVLAWLDPPGTPRSQPVLQPQEHVYRPSMEHIPAPSQQGSHQEAELIQPRDHVEGEEDQDREEHEEGEEQDEEEDKQDDGEEEESEGEDGEEQEDEGKEQQDGDEEESEDQTEEEEDDQDQEVEVHARPARQIVYCRCYIGSHFIGPRRTRRGG